MALAPQTRAWHKRRFAVKIKDGAPVAEEFTVALPPEVNIVGS